MVIFTSITSVFLSLFRERVLFIQKQTKLISTISIYKYDFTAYEYMHSKFLKKRPFINCIIYFNYLSVLKKKVVTVIYEFTNFHFFFNFDEGPVTKHVQLGTDSV